MYRISLILWRLWWEKCAP